MKNVRILILAMVLFALVATLFAAPNPSLASAGPEPDGPCGQICDEDWENCPGTGLSDCEYACYTDRWICYSGWTCVDEC